MGEGVPVRAADVLAPASDEVPCECGVIHHVTMKPEAILGLLSEAADHARFTVIDNETGALLRSVGEADCIDGDEPGQVDLCARPVLEDAEWRPPEQCDGEWCVNTLPCPLHENSDEVLGEASDG